MEKFQTKIRGNLPRYLLTGVIPIKLTTRRIHLTKSITRVPISLWKTLKTA